MNNNNNNTCRATESTILRDVLCWQRTQLTANPQQSINSRNVTEAKRTDC